jgi:hypothetical protein
VVTFTVTAFKPRSSAIVIILTRKASHFGGGLLFWRRAPVLEVAPVLEMTPDLEAPSAPFTLF